MKHKPSVLQSAFFNLRLLVALSLCLVGGLFAIVAFKSGTHQNVAQQTLTAPQNDEQIPRYMPVPGVRGQNESRDLEQLEGFWADHLSYPTGKFNPAWVRAAADQHKAMTKALPAGSFLDSSAGRPFPLDHAA